MSKPQVPPATRSTSQFVFDYVLDKVLGLDTTDGQIAKSLRRIRLTTLDDLLMLTKDQIQDLHYRGYPDGDTSLPMEDIYVLPWEVNRLLGLKGFNLLKRSQGLLDDLQDWLLVTPKDFRDYILSADFLYFDSEAKAPGQLSPGVIQSIKQATISTHAPRVQNFQKSIRRDPDIYPILKDEKEWDDWARRTRVHALAQDVAEVLDPKYVPTATDERELFELKQKYMFSVFTSRLNTDYGKALIRKYAATTDAQQLFLDLETHALASTDSMLISKKLLSWVTSAKLGKDTWNGTLSSYVLYWEEQVRLYESYVDPSSYFSEDMKLTLLQNAVEAIPDLRQVRTSAEILAQQSGNDLTYVSYRQLLSSACARADADRTSRGARGAPPPRRTVYQADLYEDSDWPSAGPDFHIDTPVDVVSAYAARMSGTQWHNLDAESQRIWDTLSEEAKGVILGGRSSSNRPPRSLGRPSPRHPPRPASSRAAHLADSSPPPIMGSHSGDDNDAPDTEYAPDPDPPPNQFLAMVANQAPTPPPAALTQMMSLGRARDPGESKFRPPSSNRKVTVCDISYSVSRHERRDGEALVDRGANGGLAGNDMRVIETSAHKVVHVEGIDNHQMRDIPVVTAGAAMKTKQGTVIGIFHQYAHIGNGTSIHSAIQMESYKQDVNDRSVRAPGGQQRILTLDGYEIPINIRNGLPYIAMRPYTDSEWDTFPHVIMTSEADWDPSVLDHAPGDDVQWFDAVSHTRDKGLHANFNEYGEYTDRYVVTSAAVHDKIIDERILPPQLTFIRDDHYLESGKEGLDDSYPGIYEGTYKAEPQDDGKVVPSDEYQGPLDHHDGDGPTSQVDVNRTPRKISASKPDYESLRPLFAYQPEEIVKRTFEQSTQYATIPMGTYLKRRFKSPYPANNIRRRDEPLATDSVYSDTPAVDDGSTIAQVYFGTESNVGDAIGMKYDKQFLNSLEDIIRRRGAPTKLISDSAQVETSKRTKDVLRSLCIDDWQSEPHQQQQNPAERRYQTVKRLCNTLMDRTGSPANLWLLALMYVIFVLNYSACKAINYQIPMKALTGVTPDISPLLRFRFYQPVYYAMNEPSWPSDSREARGRFVGIAENVGHVMTFKILTDDTQKVITRSLVRPADDSKAPNKRADLLADEAIKVRKEYVKSKSDQRGDPELDSKPKLKLVNYEDLIGRSFLLDKEEESGERHRARVISIVEGVEDHEHATQRLPAHVKFRISVGDDKYEEIMSYDQIMSKVECDMEGDIVWKFKRITAHEGPLVSTHRNYKGSLYNVMVEWENGEITSEPLKTIAADDPVTCAIYARDNDLLEVEGWKRFRTIAKRQKKYYRMVNQAKLRSYNHAPRYKYGFEVPRDYKHAVWLDKRNGNTRWTDATKLEMKQLDDYSTFEDVGPSVPPGFKRIRVHLVFDVKHDGRHKARLVADGHLTEVPLESVYSGVVSLRGLRIVTFLAELNKLELWATDIGNAYLEAYTKEKICIRAGPEFGDLEGRTLVIRKALYGLRTSGLRWHERLAACLKDEGFQPCKADPDVWLRLDKEADVYEYVAVYVDDLAIAMKNPKAFVDLLVDKYKFKLKGTGPISFHLGCDFERDEDGVLCLKPRKYVDRMMANYEQMFGEKPPTRVTSPLEKNDHPELDDSELCNEEEIKTYQSLIGSLQWAVSLGRIDITTAVMTLSRFRSLPRKGHLDRAKRVCSYLRKMADACIRIRVHEPDLSGIPTVNYDWATSVYGEMAELLPDDAPEPKGCYVLLIHYVDANLYHDMLTGRSVTGIIHFMNATPIDWFSKRQSTVETATYGSEFVAARTCVEQIMDLRSTLRYYGVPIRGRSYMFGDNETVVNSSSQPHAKLHKRHTALSFHRVREAIASGICWFIHIPGAYNPSDILSKHWGYQQVWPLLQPLLFWKGDVANIEKPPVRKDGE